MSRVNFSGDKEQSRVDPNRANPSFAREMVYATVPFAVSTFFDAIMFLQQDAIEELGLPKWSKWLSHISRFPGLLTDGAIYSSTDEDPLHARSNALRRVALDTAFYEAAYYLEEHLAKRAGLSGWGTAGLIFPTAMYASEVAGIVSPYVDYSSTVMQTMFETARANSNSRVFNALYDQYYHPSIKLKLFALSGAVKLLALPSKAYDNVMSGDFSRDISTLRQEIYQLRDEGHIKLTSFDDELGLMAIHETVSGVFKELGNWITSRNSVIPAPIEQHLFTPTQGAFEEPFVLDRLKDNLIFRAMTDAKHTAQPISIDAKATVFEQLGSQHRAMVMQQLQQSLYGHLELKTGHPARPAVLIDPDAPRVKLFKGSRDPLESTYPASNYYTTSSPVVYQGNLPSDYGITMNGGEIRYTVPTDRINASISVDGWGLFGLAYQLLKEYRLSEPQKSDLRQKIHVLAYCDNPSIENEKRVRNATDDCWMKNIGNREVRSRVELTRWQFEKKDTIGLRAGLKRVYFTEPYNKECSNLKFIDKPWEFFPYNEDAIALKADDHSQKGQFTEALASNSRATDITNTRSSYDYVDSQGRVDPEGRKHKNEELQRQRHHILYQQAKASKDDIDIDACIAHQHELDKQYPDNIQQTTQFTHEADQLNRNQTALEWGAKKLAHATEVELIQHAERQEKSPQPFDALKTYRLCLDKITDKKSEMAYVVHVKIRDFYIKHGSAAEAKNAAEKVCKQDYVQREDAYIANLFSTRKDAQNCLQKYQDIKPGDINSLKAFEEVFLKPYKEAAEKGKLKPIHSGEFELLEDAFKEAAKCRDDKDCQEYADHRLQNQQEYFKHQVLCDRLEGTGIFVQLIIGLNLRGMQAGEARRWLATADAALSLGLRVGLPYWRSAKQLEKVSTKFINGTRMAVVGASTLFHLAQEHEWISPNHWVNPAAEAGLFLYEAGSFTYEVLGRLGVIEIAASSIQITATGGVEYWLDIGSQYGSGISLGLRGYELGCRAVGSKLPENVFFHGAKNFCTYAPIALKLGTLAVATFGAIPVAIGGVVVGGVLIAGGGEWIHEKTTVADQCNALARNAQLDIDAKNVDSAIENYNKSLQLKPDPEVEYRRNSLRLYVAANAEDKDLNSESAWNDYQKLRQYSLEKEKNTKKEDMKTLLENRETFKQQITAVLLRTVFVKSKSDNYHPHAMQQLARYLEVKPDEKIAEQRRVVEYEWDFKSEKYDVLLQKCEEKLRDKKTDALALQFAGLVHMQQHNWKFARQYFEDLVQVEKDNVQARIYLSQVAKAQHDLAAAEKIATDAEEVARTSYEREVLQAEKDRADPKKDQKDQKENPQLEIAERQYHAAQRQRKLLEDEITGRWLAAAGQITGRVAAEAITHCFQFGSQVVSSWRKTEADENCELPMWQKAGKYSRTPLQPQPDHYNAMRLGTCQYS